MPRASGKTTLLIKESAKTGRPIIEPNTFFARYVEEQAKEMGLNIPEPISATSWNGGYYRGSNFNRIDGFLIDEVDLVLANIFGKPIVKATYTEEKVGMQKKYLREKEDKMKKFKVGDVVKVKSVEEMGKSPIYGKLLDLFENTTHEILDINEFGYYKLEGCTGVEFDDFMLEDLECTKSNIFNINVIVPDKVVEIEFYDGKEKMVCHEDDVFDLRKCCFIAIAKHLYKKEYTQEGIEHMATQLTYQKKYVKIVDKALKDYKKKEEEKPEKIRKEEEEKIVRARQSLKRRKQKERRAQKHKEVLVDLIADSINEAKKRRKANK